MRAVWLAVVALAASASAQSYFQPSQPPQRAPPPPRTGPVGFSPLARFPTLEGGAPPHAFRPAAPVVDDDEDDNDAVLRNVVTPSPSPLFVSQQAYRRPTSGPAPAPQPARSQQQPQQRRPGPAGPARGAPFAQHVPQEELDEDLEKEEEPDKLSLLLPQSKFDCSNRKTGYYADDGLNCEVFHYCQDNVRHSWICPEGFLFHQVHLICMPPSGDNICKQSSQFHFVNDYLYRPINAEEAQTKPNVTLRYSDRYYPDNYYEEGEERPQRPPQSPSTHAASAPLAPAGPPRRPQPLAYRPAPQVFHSPEEVNIPLTHRRPPNSQQQRIYQQPQAAPSRQHHQQQQQQQQGDDDFEYDDGPFRG